MQMPAFWGAGDEVRAATEPAEIIHIVYHHSKQPRRVVIGCIESIGREGSAHVRVEVGIEDIRELTVVGRCRDDVFARPRC